MPAAGSNVTIQGRWKMYLDLPEVDVEKLEIQGKLKFEDTRDIVLNATWVSGSSKFLFTAWHSGTVL